MSIETINAVRIANLLDYIGLDDISDLENLNDGDFIIAGADDNKLGLSVTECVDTGREIWRYLLHEKGRYKNDWFSLHPTPEDAANYNDGQEYAEDWADCTLVDLDTRDEFWPERKTTFVRIERVD